MKKQQIEKMESLFHLIQHEWQAISPLELATYQLAGETRLTPASSALTA